MHTLTASQLDTACKLIAALRRLWLDEAHVTKDGVTITLAKVHAEGSEPRWTAAINDTSVDDSNVVLDMADKALDELERMVWAERELTEAVAQPASPTSAPSPFAGRSRYHDRINAGPGSKGRPQPGNRDVDVAENTNRRAW